MRELTFAKRLYKHFGDELEAGALQGPAIGPSIILRCSEEVFKAHRLLYHPTLGLRVIHKKKKMFGGGLIFFITLKPRVFLHLRRSHPGIVICISDPANANYYTNALLLLVLHRRSLSHSSVLPHSA